MKKNKLISFLFFILAALCLSFTQSFIGKWVYDKTLYEDNFNFQNKEWNEKMNRLISYEFESESKGYVVMEYKGEQKKIPFVIQQTNNGFELVGEGLTNLNFNFKNNQLIINHPKIGKAIYIKSN